jgi:alkylation response protein AidB-like acyl-CoA dehydrogenase
MVNKFGSAEQKEKLLPAMCKLDVKASYCLTEPGMYVCMYVCTYVSRGCGDLMACCFVFRFQGSGSDAGSLITRAELDTATDEYVINGGKAFISGAGSHVAAPHNDTTIRHFHIVIT